MCKSESDKEIQREKDKERESATPQGPLRGQLNQERGHMFVQEERSRIGKRGMTKASVER